MNAGNRWLWTGLVALYVVNIIDAIVNDKGTSAIAGWGCAIMLGSTLAIDAWIHQRDRQRVKRERAAWQGWSS